MLGQNILKVMFIERSITLINVLLMLRENILRTTFSERLLDDRSKNRFHISRQ